VPVDGLVARVRKVAPLGLPEREQAVAAGVGPDDVVLQVHRGDPGLDAVAFRHRRRFVFRQAGMGAVPPGEALGGAVDLLRECPRDPRDQRGALVALVLQVRRRHVGGAGQRPVIGGGRSPPFRFADGEAVEVDLEALRHALRGGSAPNPEDVGAVTEARQYSGRAVEEGWRCPFRHGPHADPGPTDTVEAGSTTRVPPDSSRTGEG
jgi:hypothetical protein